MRLGGLPLIEDFNIMTRRDDDYEPVARSRAGPGEVSDPIDDDEVNTALVRNAENEPDGFVINWRAEDGEWMYAETKDSYMSLVQ